MAEQFWANDPVAQPKGEGVTFIPNPGAGLAQNADQRDDTRTGIAVEGNQRDAARFGLERGDKALEQTDKIAERYNKDPTIAGYRESLGNFATGLRTSDTPQGDNALITAYVKVFDPGSVVNEGEREGVASGQGALPTMLEKAKRDFGMNEAGLFTPEARKRIRREMISIMGQRAKGYNQRRSYYTKQAEAFNLDPSLIVGDHDADPFVEQFRNYDKANHIGEYSPEAIARRAADEYRPDPGDVQTGFDLPGRETSDITGGRLQPQNEAAWKAFLEASQGDPSFGQAKADAFLKSLGEPGGLSLDPEFIDAVRKGQGVPSGIDYSQSDEARKQAALDLLAERGGMGRAESGEAGVQKGVLLNLSDEIAGGIGGIGSLIKGEGWNSGYERERDVERAAQQVSRDQNGIAPEVVGGFLTPASVLQKGNMVRDAAAMGAIAGFGEGEGGADSFAKTLTGGALGAVAGRGLEAAAPYVAKVATPAIQKVKDAVAKPGQREFVEAADNLGLDYMAADIPGATGSRMATSVSKMTLGGVPIVDRARKIIDAAAEKKGQIARAIGPKADQQATGQAAKRGMGEWEAAAKDKSWQMHEAIPIKPDTAADLSNTRAALADVNAGLTSNRALSDEIVDPTLLRYQRALESGGLSWADTKKFRTYIGEQIGKPSVTQTMSKGDLKRLYAGLSEDMRATASAEGPRALKAFERANDYTRGMEQRREEVLTSLLGKNYDKGDEAAFNQIQSWAKKDTGDWSKLSRAMRSLPEEDANIVRATIVDRLGMARKGSQDAGGEVFSPAEFMTQWNGMDKRARAILFQGEHRKALDDLATYFSGLKGASQDFANTSRSGLITSAVGTAASFGMDVMTGTMAAIGQLGAGKFLSSKLFATWMSALSRKPNPAAMLQHIEKLTAVARAEPVIANDIFTLQQRLAESFAQPSALRSAAEENDDVGKRPPSNGERNDAP